MSDDLDALVRRLTNFANGCRRSMWQSRDETIRLCDAAAATITQLRAELAAANERAEKAEADTHAALDLVADTITRAVKAEADAAALRAALEQITALDDNAECCGHGVCGGYSPPECCGNPTYGLDRAQIIARAILAAAKEPRHER